MKIIKIKAKILSKESIMLINEFALAQKQNFDDANRYINSEAQYNPYEDEEYLNFKDSLLEEQNMYHVIGYDLLNIISVPDGCILEYPEYQVYCAEPIESIIEKFSKFKEHEIIE